MTDLLRFTDWNIERIKAGAKTQTRRPIKPQPPLDVKSANCNEERTSWYWFKNEPYGHAGDFEPKYKIGDVVQLADSRGNPVDTRVRITDVRVEQPQDISEADALAEGCENKQFFPGDKRLWRDYSKRTLSWFVSGHDWKRSFASLWGTIYGPENQFGWDANPWCWVYEFEVAT